MVKVTSVRVIIENNNCRSCGGREQKINLSERKRVDKKMVFSEKEKKTCSEWRCKKGRRKRGRLMIVSKSGYLSVRKCLFDTPGGGGISGFQEKKSAVYMGTCFLFCVICK